MTLVVEDGTGLPNAQSYVSVADADAYHSARINEAWAELSDEEKEAALLKAVQHMDSRYWNQFAGERVSTAQALAWPRIWYTSGRSAVNAITSIAEPVLPQCVKDAQCELAARASASELSPDLDRGGAIASKQVGSLAISYFEGAPGGKTFPLVDSILSRVLTARTGGALVRS